jgi:hypothetical protein
VKQFSAVESIDPTASELRAERARHRILLWTLSQAVGLAPDKLSLYLNERRPMPAGVAERIREALTRLAR